MSQSVMLVQFNTQIIFHPTYSSGTASVFGSIPLVSPYHHYWEVKMLSPVYGTDMMVGLATKEINTTSHTHSFASLLGHDSHSWGFSYQGFVQHKGKKVVYGRRWGKGNTVGVHYDSWRGTLEFYLDRQPLGLAFSGLQGKEVFPIVSSTAAKSEMKLITAQSFQNNLQFSCLKKLSDKLPGSGILNLYLPPGLRSFIQNNYWFFINLQTEKCLQISSDSPPAGSAGPGLACKFVDDRFLVKMASPAKRKAIEDDSQSEDEECFLLRPKNLRSKKLALMRKCQAAGMKNSPGGGGLSSPLSQPTPCTSQDVHYMKDDSPATTPVPAPVLDTVVQPSAEVDTEEEVIFATPQRKKRFTLRKK
eukprot:GFUD01004108.1.p1 GENE.GFUD01004108.1~~GFUD01004108.1.p1  ORF type:complete len:413 (+),score=155.34 GFUD01004108.1:158-1240(+)